MLKAMERIARLMAVVGGLVLVALILLTCLSVVGRSLNTIGHSAALEAISQGLANLLLGTGVGPINGDFELVEAGIAFVIFAFLPVCQIYSSHATVDVFTSLLSNKTNRYIKAFWEVLFCLLMLLITWRLFVGMENKMEYGETTYLLQFPVWWAYAASFAAAVLASIVSVYCAVARLAELVSGRHYLPYTDGAVH
ncbi:TRAP transporter small permease subunit [uncultured Cohaesibacter sp.]|uniref:TRAP transporter small permease n=1 Tax=uncultured Cohaesibacter sp. TaxID=1002546 RepID=UPI00292DD0B0|nr:TRAP transporter small permease subunit [uncultured Cohaesibacter sp.]